MPRLLGSPNLMHSGDGRLELFAIALDGQLHHRWQTAWGDGWSGWRTASDGAKSAPPAMARHGDGRLMVFFDGKSIEQTGWSGAWSAVPDSFIPPEGLAGRWPTITAGADGKLVLFVPSQSGEGTPFTLWSNSQSAWSNGWASSWTQHGNPGTGYMGPPCAVRDAEGRIQVFVVASGGELWVLKQDAPAGSWGGWDSLGTAGAGFSDRPAVAASGDGRLELFILDRDGVLWHRWQRSVGGPWSTWKLHGDAEVGFEDHPAIAASADCRLEVFVTGKDGNLWHILQKSANNGWSNWLSHGNGGAGLMGGPAVWPNGDRRLETFAIGTDGNLWHIWQTSVNNGWSTWLSHGQP